MHVAVCGVWLLTEDGARTTTNACNDIPVVHANPTYVGFMIRCGLRCVVGGGELVCGMFFFVPSTTGRGMLEIMDYR